MKEDTSNGLFYFLTTHQYEWADAAGACADRGMQLADVSDANKHSIVIGHFGSGSN